MDTKLLDTCREARGELEYSRREETNHAHNYQKVNIVIRPVIWSHRSFSHSSASKKFLSIHSIWLQLNGVKPNDEFIVDPKRLRCWLRHMQNELSKFPSISDAIKMKDFELIKLQKKILVSELEHTHLLDLILECQYDDEKW